MAVNTNNYKQFCGVDNFNQERSYFQGHLVHSFLQIAVKSFGGWDSTSNFLSFEFSYMCI